MYFRKKEFIQAEEGTKRQIEKLEKELNLLKSGKIVCRKRGDKIFYTEVTSDGEKGITSDKRRIKEITRAEYLKKQLEILKGNSRTMEYCVKHYRDDYYKEIINALHVRHPNLPVENILFANSKKKQVSTREKNPYYPENLKFVTTNGVYVRSKSEREIGNALEALGIQYESDVLIECDNARYYADFIITRPNGRKLVWEHFGKENDGSYMAKNSIRIRDYIKLGLRPWEDLIWTLDSDIEDSRTIRRIIQRFILSELDSN